SGECYFFLGKNYRLRGVDVGDESLRLGGSWFLLRRGGRAAAAAHFKQWYLANGLPWISTRVEMWQPRGPAEVSGIAVGDLGFRWGSCGKNRALRFNWRLLQLPVRLIDYVIVHELAHLLIHNHSPEFWRVMDRTLPDWEERKTALESRWQSFVVFG